MSGGSYNYICFADVVDLFHNQRNIESMYDRLHSLGYADDAANETIDMLVMIRDAYSTIENYRKRLEPVWKAVEWWDSNDSGEEEVKKALDEYRK